MLTKSNIVWTVTPLSTPTVMRGCAKCGQKREFRSSGLFRVNANGRNLDVWLIYRCEHCGGTWNLAVHSRVKPEKLDKAAYQAYLGNDARMAFQCAFDKSILNRNGAAPRYDGVDYDICGEAVDFDADSAGAEVTLASDFDLDVKVSKIVRAKLELSASGFARLVEEHRIELESGDDPNKAKLKSGMKVIFRGGQGG